MAVLAHALRPAHPDVLQVDRRVVPGFAARDRPVVERLRLDAPPAALAVSEVERHAARLARTHAAGGRLERGARAELGVVSLDAHLHLPERPLDAEAGAGPLLAVA